MQREDPQRNPSSVADFLHNINQKQAKGNNMIFEKNEIPLWPSVPPLSHGNETAEELPTLTIYRPPLWKSNKKSIVILPGGAYTVLAPHEGQGYAEYFASQGFHCFVVKYRLGSNKYHHPAELSDAARAVRLVRSAAEELGLRADCVGIMGSSAGGHLAASLGNLYTQALIAEDEGAAGRISSRPDWTILCYPVISADPAIAHKGSFNQLTGTENPSEELLRDLSLERSVHARTPPAFIWHTLEDKGVPCDNSMEFARALRKNKIAFELHIYEKGGHGTGLFSGHPWAEECIRWMNCF